MPELPEVEHIVTWLRPQLAGRTLARLELVPGGARCVPQGAAAVNRRLRGATVTGLRRRAKVMLVDFDREERLAVHLKLTGQLWVGGEHPYARVRVHFKAGEPLVLADARKFAWVRLWSAAEEAAFEAATGPEPVPALPPGWAAGLTSRRAVKAVLLDQVVVAGIGNIYADEILFRARLAPTRPAASLTAAERRRLQTAVEREMAAAVAERTGVPDQKRVGGGDRSVKALFDWRVFQRAGEPCPGCGRAIVRTVVAGRGTYRCRACQR
jgi:formamidopyrimidine-DNA glycosylase